MRIVGIDPGTQRCGFAVIEMKGAKSVIHEIGVWNLMGKGRIRPPLGERLEILHTETLELFSKHNPHWIGLEKAVTFKNVDSALKLSEARGIIRLSAHQKLASAENRLIEISPTAVKKNTSGWGASGKESILRVLSLRFLGLEKAVEGKNFSYDAFDALAIAWTAWILSRSKTNISTLSHGIEHGT